MQYNHSKHVDTIDVNTYNTRNTQQYIHNLHRYTSIHTDSSESIHSYNFQKLSIDQY